MKGTVGGLVMDVGFSFYGVLMFVAAVQTVRYAMARHLLNHQAWAWRLYALAIGSWLYRMDYGLWLILTDWVGHTEEFNGWFDHIMAFLFYIPNLLIVELMIRARSQESSKRLRTTVLGACARLRSTADNSHLGIRTSGLVACYRGFSTKLENPESI